MKAMWDTAQANKILNHGISVIYTESGLYMESPKRLTGNAVPACSKPGQRLWALAVLPAQGGTLQFEALYKESLCSCYESGKRILFVI